MVCLLCTDFLIFVLDFVMLQNIYNYFKINTNNNCTFYTNGLFNCKTFLSESTKFPLMSLLATVRRLKQEYLIVKHQAKDPFRHEQIVFL